MSYLAKDRTKIYSLSEIAKKTLLPYRFLGQLAGQLRQSGIVVSREGVKGGYGLGKDWEKKSLFDLAEALGENGSLVECLRIGHSCSREDGCGLRGVWQKLENKIKLEMKKIKLGEI